MFDLVIKNTQIARPDGSRTDADLACLNGSIERIEGQITVDATETVDAQGHLLLPGVIDPQVHFREPGATHKEDLGSGSRAAVRGGVTSFLEMPNCRPATVDQTQLDWKLARAERTCVANFGFFIGATKDNLAALNNTHPACGIKIFMGSSTGDLLVDDLESLDRIFSCGRRLIAVHAEDEERIKQRTIEIIQPSVDPLPYSLHSEVRDPETALIATRRAVELSEKYGRRLHILHLSTASEVDYLRANKPAQSAAKSFPITCS